VQKKSYEVELRGNTRNYRTEFGRAVSANDAFNRSVKGVGQGAQVIQGPMGGVASRIGVINSLFTSGNVAIAGFAAGLATLTAGAYKSLKVFDEYQRGQLKTEALVKATGNAAGFSAAQLQDQANEVALNTLASVGGIVEAQNVLQTFKSVSGDTFKQTIALSQDMAAVFGGTAKDKAVQLGKALEDPIKGITALNKSGVSFTQNQKDMIKSMVDMGDTAGAQRIILRQVADQIGGAGAAEAGGLSGDVDTLSQRWDELLLSFASTSGAGDVVSGWLKSISGGLKSIKENIEPSLGGLEEKLIKLEQLQAKSSGRRQRPGRKSGGNSSLSSEIESVKNQILELKASKGDVDAINALLEQTDSKIANLDAQAATASTKRRSGNAGRNGSEKERIEREKFQLELQRQQYIDHLQKIEEADRQHIETKKQLAEETQATSDSLAEKEQAKAEQKQARIVAQNEREVQALRDKYTSINDAALAAQDKEIQLEQAQYERKLANLERDFELLDQKGLVTAELKAAHDLALQELEATHQASITDIKQQAIDEQVQQEAEKNQKISEGYTQMLDAVGSYFDGMGTKQGKYLSLATKIGDALLSDKKQKTLDEIRLNTESAAMAAYNALAGIPIVGPTLGVLAKGAVYVAGAAASSKVLGIAHSGMTNIPTEGTYLLDGGERIVQPEQNRDLGNFLKAQDNAQAGQSSPRVEVHNYENTAIRYTTESDVVRIIVGQMSNQSSEGRNGLHATSNVQPRGRS
jgi:hypothetical protein